ncbi:competence protein CoiA family protein [Streptomyces sp. 7R007]
MTYSVWHRGLGITLDLTEADLGHPEYPGLLDEIYGNYQPDLLYCLEAHEDEGFICPGFMTIRKVNGRPHAMHVAKGERPETKAESDLHKALREYTAKVAAGEGFRVTRPEDADQGKLRADVTVEGVGARRLGYEIQLSAIAGGSVDERTRLVRQAGLTPLWLVNNENAIPIDRAPWARLNVQSWRDVTDRAALPVRGGIKHLHMSRCDWSSPVPCPRQGAGRCGGRHGLWEPVAGLYYDDVIRRTATGELVSLYMPHPAGRRGWHMWVTPADKEEFLEGRPEPLPGVPSPRRAGEAVLLPRRGEDGQADVRRELTRARDDELPIDASLWHTEPPSNEFSRPFTVGEFVIPGDLVAARRAFTRALAHCEDIAIRLPSGADIAAGRAEITDEQRERLAEARERCRRLAEEMHTHPWWETVADRHAAREALTHAATHDSA